MHKSKECTVPWHLFLAVAAVLVAIAWGALFLIAPVWQIPDTVAAYTPPEPESPSSSSSLGIETPIDVNLADEETLQLLPGIGPAKAAAILTYREEHGPFSSLSDLEEVDGISARMIESWSGMAIAGTN